MMKRLVTLGLPLLSLLACVRPAVVAPVEAVVAPVASAANDPLPPPDPPRDTTHRLPAGPGVTLIADQLHALVAERKITDRSLTFEQRLAIAEKALGVHGETSDDPLWEGVSFRGVSGRSLVAPFGCQELIIAKRAPLYTVRPTDHRRCGLPYASDPTKPWSGLAPKRTAFRLEEALGAFGLLPPADAVLQARVKLGPPDSTEDGESRWAGMGARGKDAPITCWLLHLGGRARIDEVPLPHCMLTWPMPGMTFEPGSQEPALDKNAKLAECANKCSANEVCMIEQRLPSTASLRTEADGMRARYPDGRAAKAELSASCAPIPATCSVLQNACFFPAPTPPGTTLPPASAFAGPCPKGSTSGSLLSTPSSHIVCHSRTPVVTALPRLIAPPSSPRAKSASKPDANEIY